MRLLTHQLFTTIPSTNMHTAQVTEWGQNPKYVEVEEPAEPSADSGLVKIKVVAAGVHQLVRSLASGKHYASKTLPHVPGADGVGTTSNGQHVYFIALGTGSFTEYAVVPERRVFPLPDGVDPLQAAAFVNPAMSSWMAFKARVSNLQPGFSVLILGATSASGTLAISLARSLGAGKVIGAARNADALASLGLDETIVLQDNVSETDFSKANDVDVVLDYLYGPVVEHLFKTITPTKPLQYVHIGSLAGLDISLPGAVLRSKDITIRGAGPGSWDLKALSTEMPALLQAFSQAKPGKVNVLSLKDIEQTWNTKGDRVVYTP